MTRPRRLRNSGGDARAPIVRHGRATIELAQDGACVRHAASLVSYASASPAPRHLDIDEIAADAAHGELVGTLTREDGVFAVVCSQAPELAPRTPAGAAADAAGRVGSVTR